MPHAHDPDQETYASSNHRSAEPINREQGGAAGENVTATKRGFQAVTWNRNANDLFACKWLRARDLNQRIIVAGAKTKGDSKSRLIPYRYL